jgi:hypothetical protein
MSREWELIDSFLTFQLVYVATALGIAHALADGPGSRPRWPARSEREARAVWRPTTSAGCAAAMLVQ